MNLSAIQSALRDAKLDGWLFFDHHERDPLAYRVLGLKGGHVSRRWYYWIPASGEPRGLVHRIESGNLESLPGERAVYSTWREQQDGVRAMLNGAKRVAMQYSPMCAIPYVANVDAGTVDLVRSFGAEIVSSAELIQFFEARWTPEMLEMLSMRDARRIKCVVKLSSWLEQPLPGISPLPNSRCSNLC